MCQTAIMVTSNSQGRVQVWLHFLCQSQANRWLENYAFSKSIRSGWFVYAGISDTCQSQQKTNQLNYRYILCLIHKLIKSYVTYSCTIWKVFCYTGLLKEYILEVFFISENLFKNTVKIYWQIFIFLISLLSPRLLVRWQHLWSCLWMPDNFHKTSFYLLQGSCNF